MGLACTDSPASLGTEMMEFCAKSTVNPLASRKHDQACFFTASVESTMEFEDEQPPQDEGKNFFARIKALLGGTQQQFNQQNGETVRLSRRLPRARASCWTVQPSFLLR